MNEVELKRFRDADEIGELAEGKLEIVRMGELTIGRATYEPGWKWAEDVGLETGSSRCKVETSVWS